jgi:8-oxo-dGTP pyrophosphatase MutT (NUDIX family)
MPKQRVQAKVILLNSDNEVLLLKRSQYSDRRAGEWELVGGGVEAGESPNIAASREIAEETGLAVKLATSDIVFAQTRFLDDGDTNVIWITYIGRTISTAVRLSEEHTEYQWAPIDKALQTAVYDIQLKALRHAYEHGFLA